LLVFAVLSGLLLLLAACGGNGASSRLNFTLSDFKYDPMEAKVPAGRENILNFKNEGAKVPGFHDQ
jgi:hypothetical protein